MQVAGDELLGANVFIPPPRREARAAPGKELREPGLGRAAGRSREEKGKAERLGTGGVLPAAPSFHQTLLM